MCVYPFCHMISILPIQENFSSTVFEEPSNGSWCKCITVYIPLNSGASLNVCSLSCSPSYTCSHTIKIYDFLNCMCMGNILAKFNDMYALVSLQLFLFVGSSKTRGKNSLNGKYQLNVTKMGMHTLLVYLFKRTQ